MKTVSGIRTAAALLSLLALLCRLPAHGEEGPAGGAVPESAATGEWDPPQPDRTEDSPEIEEMEGPPRDPFSATGKLAAQQPGRSMHRSGSVLGFRPGERPEGIPRMHLRGHLQSKDGDAVALLEIEGGDVHIVREGDTVGLHDLGYDSVLRIREIDRLHLVIESGSLGKVIIVR